MERWKQRKNTVHKHFTSLLLTGTHHYDIIFVEASQLPVLQQIAEVLKWRRRDVL